LIIKTYPVDGDSLLVDDVGYCNYCTSPQIKCKICGTVTSLDLNDTTSDMECLGGCGNYYRLDQTPDGFYIEAHRKMYEEEE